MVCVCVCLLAFEVFPRSPGTHRMKTAVAAAKPLADTMIHDNKGPSSGMGKRGQTVQ